MISNEKIKQVFSAIKDNGIEAFDDESLAKLLAILNEDELDEFEKRCYEELDGMESLKKIMDVRPFAETIIKRDLYRIRKSDLYNKYIVSLKSGEYRDFFKSLRIDELADLKKYVSYNIDIKNESNISGSKKIINMITKEIKKKEEAKKPSFEKVA